MSDNYATIRPLAEATHAFVAEQAQKAGHDVAWNQPRELHGFIQRDGDCRRCGRLVLLTVLVHSIHVDMPAACPGAEPR